MTRVRTPIILCALVLLLSGCIGGGSAPEPTRAITPTQVAQVESATPAGTTVPAATMTPEPTATATMLARATATYGTLPWPEGCTPEQVDAFVQRVIDAFNSGDTEALRGMLPDEDAATKRNFLMATASAEPAAVVGIPVALEWFSMPRRTGVMNPPVDGDYVAAHTVDEVLVFTAESYAAGMSMHLQSVMHSRDWLPTTVAFGVEVTLQIPGEPDVRLVGKAGIDCGHQRLFVWSFSVDPS